MITPQCQEAVKFPDINSSKVPKAKGVALFAGSGKSSSANKAMQMKLLNVSVACNSGVSRKSPVWLRNFFKLQLVHRKILYEGCGYAKIQKSVWLISNATLFFATSVQQLLGLFMFQLMLFFLLGIGSSANN